MISRHSSTFLNTPVSFANKNICCVWFAAFVFIVCLFPSANSADVPGMWSPR